MRGSKKQCSSLHDSARSFFFDFARTRLQYTRLTFNLCLVTFSKHQPLAQDANLRRITVSNDDGDVYVESSGDGSEIVLKTEKVRITDGDVYCGTSNLGLSAQIDALKTKDDALDERIGTLNDTQVGLRDDLDTLETSTSGRLSNIDTTLTSLASADTSLSATDASLSSRIDTLNATDAQLKATDETFATRIASLNATDTALKGVDDDLSSRIDALRDIYVNELNVTDKQLIVTDATLGNRIDELNATQNELKSADAALSSRIATLESAHTEYERIDDEVASLIDALNATDATMQATDASLSDRIDALNATNQALNSVDDSFSAQIASLMPPKCTSPTGLKLRYDGANWTCVCAPGWNGTTCDSSTCAPGQTTYVSLPYDSWCGFSSVHLHDRNKILLTGGLTCSDLHTVTSSFVKHTVLVDLSTGTAQAMSDMPTGSDVHASVYHDGKVYTIGGRTSSSFYSNHVQIYDVDSDTWSTSTASYPFKVWMLECTMYESNVVCSGGYTGSFKSSVYYMDVSATAPSWVALPSLSSGLELHTIVTVNQYVYVIAGYCNHNCYTSSVEVLDMTNPTSWTTTSASIPDSRLSALTTVMNGKIYVISGVTPGPAGDFSSRRINRSYLVADAAASIASWTKVDVELSERECSGNCDGRLRAGDIAYVSNVTGVTALSPNSTSAIELRTIVCPES